MTELLIYALLLIFALGFFALAWWSDRSGQIESARFRAAVYALSIPVYYGSWIYFSSIGNASRYGWNYITAYLGAALAFSLFFPVMFRAAGVVKQENIGSIADFLSSRYGKSRSVGTLVACLALIGSLPFIAMQLKGLSMAWSAVTRTEGSPFGVLAFAVILAGFVVAFGARNPTITEHNRGLVKVVALESVMKIAVMALVAILSVAVILSFSNGAGWTDNLGALSEPIRFDGGFFNSTLMVIAGIFCAPRQFYIGFVELEKLGDLKRARWLILAYIMVACLMVIPIVIAGTMIFHGQGAETYIFSLPQQFGGKFLTALVFLGAFSCIAAMVTVETVALSTMISNELVLPVLARTGWHANPDINIGRIIINIRRAAICALLLLGWSYFYWMRRDVPLGSMSLVAASGYVQFLPAFIGALYWRRGHARGAIAGLCGGFAIWLYAIAAPQFLNNFGVVYDLGLRLAAASGTDQFVQKVLLSLLVNTSLYVGISLSVRPRLIDRLQAMAFVNTYSNHEHAPHEAELRGTVGDMKKLVAQFLGQEFALHAFEDLEKDEHIVLNDSDRVNPTFARATERMLGGVIGSALARRVVGWHLSDEDQRTTDALDVLDDTAQAVQFNRELLQVALNHMSQGVYVVDQNGRLIAWNSRYIELFHFPRGFIHVGLQIGEAIRFGLRDLKISAEVINARVQLRLTEIRHGIPHDSERRRSDGSVLKVLGSPMPGGRYVTSFTDVTELRRSASALQHANERLEERVEIRTRELTAANVALADAKIRAERATNAQARFIAAASHDLLQPLQAARLFIGTVIADHPADEMGTNELLRHADDSIESADRLMRALLNLSRLEIGGVKPEVRPVSAVELLAEMGREFERVAAEKGVSLRIASTHAWVLSDPDLLRSVLQNLIGNAIRYTVNGSVLVGCRNDQGKIRFEVRDSGEGIPEDSHKLIFKEFARLHSDLVTGRGVGLGLSIAQRICNLLGHTLRVRSRPGYGSTFSVTVPRGCAPENLPVSVTAARVPVGLRVLCVENEIAVLQGMQSLFTKFGADVSIAASASEALALDGSWDVILADYHLEQGGNGLDLLESMTARGKVFALLTANASEEVIERAASLNIEVIRKPVSSLYLRTFLARATHLAIAAE